MKGLQHTSSMIEPVSEHIIEQCHEKPNVLHIYAYAEAKTQISFAFFPQPPYKSQQFKKSLKSHNYQLNILTLHGALSPFSENLMRV